VNGESALLWTEAMLAWTVAAYGFDDPSSKQELNGRAGEDARRWKVRVWLRSGILAIVLALLPAAGFVCVAALSHARAYLAERESSAAGWSAPRDGVWLAEGEVAFNTAFALVSALIVIGTGWTMGRPLVRVPLPTAHLAGIAGIAALALFMGRGGAYIVRGILNQVDVLPGMDPDPGPLSPPAAERIDLTELRRGRLIGVLERLILIIFMGVKAYQAIGFLIAAKGLIRSKELENRNFAEYFLIGTLASTMIAIAAGVLVQLILQCFWTQVP
jgi:hypothetical protein